MVSCDKKIWGISYELSGVSRKGEKLILQTPGNITLIPLALSVTCNIIGSLASAFAQSQSIWISDIRIPKGITTLRTL